ACREARCESRGEGGHCPPVLPLNGLLVGGAHPTRLPHAAPTAACLLRPYLRALLALHARHAGRGDNLGAAQDGFRVAAQQDLSFGILGGLGGLKDDVFGCPADEDAGASVAAAVDVIQPAGENAVIDVDPVETEALNREVADLDVMY